MAFARADAGSAENKKQHLNLSLQAYEVMESDMFTFGEEQRSGFINRIFEAYAPVAEASISRSLNSLRGELDKLLAGVPGDEGTKSRIIRKLLDRKKVLLKEQSDSYGGGRAFKFWLNKKNLSYLTEDESECGEQEYYGTRRGKYIKNVLEEYARLPYVQRELIYFQPYVEEIRCAIEGERQLRVVTGCDRVYSVYPWGILCDPLCTANYLVGYCKRYSVPEDEKRPCSFRISALRSVKAERSKSAFLKESERKRLAQAIASRGVQFLASEEEWIQVRLTVEGRKRYRRQIHLRPPFVRQLGEDVFEFRCTAAQAEFYFFKFGRDAEILQPPAFRERFRSLYEGALDVYRDSE